MTTFSSLDEAIAKGFVIASARQYMVYRHCIFFGHDTSGRGLKGLSFGLRVEVPEEFTTSYLGTVSDKAYGHSTNVQFARLSNGSVKTLQMFDPREFDEAVRLCKAWADMWFRAHPEAISRINEQKLAAINAVQVGA